jgi:hypothetical protein
VVVFEPARSIYRFPARQADLADPLGVVGAIEQNQVGLFTKRINVAPDAGDILMHFFGRPTMLAPMQTPASKETGVCIGLVAGARFAPDSDSLPVVTARWLYAGVKQATREMVRVGVTA